MATATIRTTYALDQETVERLDRLAKQWNLSRSAALRKLVREASEATKEQKLAAWERLSGSLSPQQAKAWVREIRAERRASDGRRRRGGNLP